MAHYRGYRPSRKGRHQVSLAILGGKTANSSHTSNHGSFYYNQLASVQLLLGDTAAAQSTIEEYFNGIYLGQISANGDQVSLGGLSNSNLV